MLADAVATGSSEGIFSTNVWISPPFEGPLLYCSITNAILQNSNTQEKQLGKGAATAAVTSSRHVQSKY